MCEPISLSTAATLASAAIGAATAVVGGIGAMQQGRNNARAARAEAANQLAIGQIEDQQSRQEMRRALALQRAQLANAGVALDSVTSLALGQDAGEQAALEGQAVRANRINQASALEAEARLEQAQGRRQLLGGFASAAGSVLAAGPELFAGFGGGRVPKLGNGRGFSGGMFGGNV